MSNSPLHIMTEDTELCLPLEASGTNIFADTRTPMQRELEECPHVVLCLPHSWDPQNVQFSQSSRSLEEEIQMRRTIGSISYHRCREAVAVGTARVAKEGTLTNLLDLFTKLLSAFRREELLHRFTY